MDTAEIEKSTAHITVEIIEYMPNAIVVKRILKKNTGHISIMSFDSGEGLTEKTVAFDTYVQLIDGHAEIVIADEATHLHVGQSIVVPAHTRYFVKPNGRFKMIQTVIKSGYE